MAAAAKATCAGLTRLKRLLGEPANRACADCAERNPRFASTTFGVFLCNRCFGVHRGLGTHITVVSCPCAHTHPTAARRRPLAARAAIWARTVQVTAVRAAENAERVSGQVDRSAAASHGAGRQRCCGANDDALSALWPAGPVVCSSASRCALMRVLQCEAPQARQWETALGVGQRPAPDCSVRSLSASPCCCHRLRHRLLTLCGRPLDVFCCNVTRRVAFECARVASSAMPHPYHSRCESCAVSLWQDAEREEFIRNKYVRRCRSRLFLHTHLLTPSSFGPKPQWAEPGLA